MPYDLKPVRAPKLRGRALRLFATLMESAWLRPLVLPGLFKRTGVTDFRERRSLEAPTPHPLAVPTALPDASRPPRAGIEIAEEAADRERHGSPSGFRFTSIADYARAYRDRTISPEEVGNRIIAAIEASNRAELPLRAVINSEADDIRRQAEESARRLAEGRTRSVLEGVPLAIKDELDMLPYRTQVGTRFLGDGVPEADATPVSRLRAAGALLVGKTNMFEIGISPTGNNPIHGFVRNPYHPAHDAGGSSGGSGAAVGCGMVPLALGADGGGSIRVPASHCGIVGLKPTFGRVSEFGAAPLCWSVAHVGPMGASALDAAIGYAICAGRDPKDPMSLRQPPVHLHDFHNHDLGGITLGVYPAWFEDADPEIVARCRAALERFKEAGAVIREVEVDGLEATRVAHVITILTEMAAAMAPYYQLHRKDFGHPTRINLALARQFRSIDYVHAQRIRTEAMAEWARVHASVDAVLTPTAACLPPYLDPRTCRHGEAAMGLQTELMRYVVAANFCGLPAISFPVGYSDSGLPIGMQAIAPHWQEHLLLRLANVAESRTPRRKPAVHFDVLPQAVSASASASGDERGSEPSPTQLATPDLPVS